MLGETEWNLYLQGDRCLPQAINAPQSNRLTTLHRLGAAHSSGQIYHALVEPGWISGGSRPPRPGASLRQNVYPPALFSRPGASLCQDIFPPDLVLSPTSSAF